jgi:cobalt-zinc-cadmium efflux system membrane fusion protein
MYKKTFTSGLFAICVSVVPLSASSESTIILDKNGVENLRIQTVEVETRDFETTVFAIGRIEEIPSKRSVLSSRVAGRVVDLKVFTGDRVQAGEVIALVETRQLGNPPPTIELKAPQSGLVVNSHVRLGQPVQPDAELMDISDRSEMWAVAKIPEQEAARVDLGSIAHIQVPALGGATFDAKLIRFGVNADRGAGAIEGIFLLSNPEGRLRPGMRAEFSVVLDVRADVLAVPRDSIQGDPANRVVFVKDFDLPNAFVRVPVVIGQRNDRFAEVLRGLFPGDEVVTQGSYSLGFVGGEQSMSLKEALDAAHGHEHNEDGSEMAGDKKTEESEHDHGHEGAHGWSGAQSLLLAIYAAVMSVLFLIVLQRLLNQRRA